MRLSKCFTEKFAGIPIVDWGWIFALTFWRAVIASRLTLGVDEAQYAVYGMRPDLSYFDHPPLVGWIEAIPFQLFGQSELGARLPAIACGVVSSALVYRLALKIVRNQLAARAAALALNASFLIAALWLMFIPDTILLPLVLWLVDIGARLIERRRRSDWIELGVCLGLCGIAKYNAILFVGSLIGFMLAERAWRCIRPGMAVLAALLAAVIVSPVFIWNHAHDWISFKYQSAHVLGAGLKLDKLLLFIVGQLGAYSPFLIVVAAMGWWSSRTRLGENSAGRVRARLAAWIATPMLAFFAYASLHDDVLPHWTFVAWGLIIPLGVAMALANGWRRTTWAALGVSGAITIFLMAELTGQFLRFPDWQSPYADLIGWREIHRDIEKIKSADPRHPFSIAVPNWTLGSRAAYYLSDLAPSYVLDDRSDQFDLWENGPPRTADLLILSWRGFELGKVEQTRCHSLEPIARRTFVRNGGAVNSASLAWCRGYAQ